MKIDLKTHIKTADLCLRNNYISDTSNMLKRVYVKTIDIVDFLVS